MQSVSIQSTGAILDAELLAAEEAEYGGRFGCIDGIDERLELCGAHGDEDVRVGWHFALQMCEKLDKTACLRFHVIRFAANAIDDSPLKDSAAHQVCVNKRFQITDFPLHSLSLTKDERINDKDALVSDGFLLLFILFKYCIFP